ncbi:MAG: methionyl-tRNA formyltransferase [Actinomycetota bacterium]|nr:methionyl-tRNA formyltransferase [Actinomycetota bacterium]
MRVVFLGTPAWAVPSLEALRRGPFDVAAAVTNPDKPAGRGMLQRSPPVKLAAERLDIPLQQPPSARAPEFASWLRSVAPDVAVVVAYGKLLPAEVLDIPAKGFVNLHFSLLPSYRGAAPVQRAIMNGEAVTGASIMVLTEGMDEGPVVASQSVDIAPEETAGELGDRLAESGARLLVDTLPGYVDGSIVPVEQDDAAATYAAKITTEEARIDWTRPARRVHDLVRGLNPAPGAWTTVGDARLKIWRSEVAALGETLAPGEVSAGKELIAGTGEGALILSEVQLAGKKKMSGADLARGLRMAPGTRFG